MEILFTTDETQFQNVVRFETSILIKIIIATTPALKAKPFSSCAKKVGAILLSFYLSRPPPARPISPRDSPFSQTLTRCFPGDQTMQSRFLTTPHSYTQLAGLLSFPPASCSRLPSRILPIAFRDDSSLQSRKPINSTLVAPFPANNQSTSHNFVVQSHYLGRAVHTVPRRNLAIASRNMEEERPTKSDSGT